MNNLRYVHETILIAKKWKECTEIIRHSHERKWEERTHLK